MKSAEVATLVRNSDWSALHVTVVGIAVAGFACADALLSLGAQVSVVDGAQSAKQQERAQILEVLGASVHLGDGDTLPAGQDLLVVSPGVPPTAAIITSATQLGIPIWGELELAWRLRRETDAPWLVITGTNGKTTTTLMLASMLRAAGLRTEAVGNIGLSVVDVVMNGPTYDVLAVEVGAPQLPFVHSVSPLASACLNLAPDHVDFFGSFAGYSAAKARIYERTQRAAFYNVEDEATRSMVEQADVIEGCRAIGVTLGVPAPSMLGVVDDLLVDRAFVPDRAGSAQELAAFADIVPFAPHNVMNALAAAGLARAFGILPSAVRQGLRTFTPAGHRISEIAVVDGVRFIDDSKATNGHAALSSLLAYNNVVWIAGGLAKGQTFDDLVSKAAKHLVGVVLLGQDRALISEALSRHAPQVPVVEVSRTDTGCMDEVVAAARGLARPGGTVLLAPACASWDMFRDYAQRGEEFAAAVMRSVDTS